MLSNNSCLSRLVENAIFFLLENNIPLAEMLKMLYITMTQILPQFCHLERISEQFNIPKPV